MKLLKSVLAIMIAGLLWMGMISAAPAGASPATAGASVVKTATDNSTRPDFYNPPATLPAENGKLIRMEPMRWNGILQGRAYRILYKSTNSSGQPVAVSGFYIEPWFPWWGWSARPLVSWSSGTIGQGDQCAPSRNVESALNIHTDPWSLSIGQEVLFMNGFLSRGVAIVMTDYVGLGTPGVHTYVNRVDQGHAVIDAARAARQVPAASIRKSSKVAFYGYSQGGGAAGSAAELAGSYAPEMKIAGTWAGAPPADLKEVLKGIDGSALTGLAGYSVNSFAASYPEMQTILDNNTTPEGKQVLQELSGMCTVDVFLKYSKAKSQDWTIDGSTLSTQIEREPDALRILEKQRLGKIRPNAPVRVSTGLSDRIVGHNQVRTLAQNWCAKGAQVTYVPLNQGSWGEKSVMNHLMPQITDSGAAQRWIVDRFRGHSAPGNCVNLPNLQ